MNEVNLPSMWFKTSLGEVLLSIVGGGTPSKSNASYYQGNIPWMSVKDMNKNILKDTVDHISQEAVINSSTNVIPAGTPIIATRMSLGKIIIANFDSAINQDLKALFPASGINRDYLIGWYRSIARIIEELGTGTTVKGIRLEVLNSLEFPLPPLAEQKVIADKLDTLLAQVETTKAHLDRIPEILKIFRQSVLAAAVSGKLTEEWQGNTEDWSEKKLRDICLSISDGDHQAPPRTSNGIPFLVISNVRNGFIDFSGVERWVPQYYFDELKEIRRPRRNDILYTVTGSFGIPVIVDTDERFCFQRHIAILKPNSKYLNYKFLFFLLGSIQAFRQADNIATGTAQRTVALNSLRDFKFRIPPLGQQTEIVRRVEELFAFADSIEQKTNAALERVNNLTQSILATD